MKKFYLNNGKEVKVGDTFCEVVKIKYPFIDGEEESITCTTVTEELLAKLIRTGVVVVKETADNSKQANEDTKVPMAIEYYVKNIAGRLGWKVKGVYKLFGRVTEIFPTAAFSMLLREIAIELDKKYKDHISKSPEIYVISTLNFSINKIDKSCIKNYKTFSAFRSYEDAKIACKIMQQFIEHLAND